MTARRVEAATFTTVQAAPVASTLGQTVMLTATVSPGSATGKVTFYDGIAVLGSASLQNGTAVLPTTAIAYGTRHITARYIGDASNSGSVSAAITETVTTRAGGGFVAATVSPSFIGSSRPEAVITADLNHDGHPDLVVSNANYPLSQTTVSICLNNGDGTFAAPVPYLDGNDAVSVAVADVDLDGNPDIVVSEAPGAGSPGGGVFLLKGRGDGTFPVDTVIKLSSYGGKIRIADFNGDGYPDLVVTGSMDYGGLADNPAISVLLGNGDGTFQSIPDFNWPVTISDLSADDFNGDGIPDLAVASSTGSVAVMMGNGDGTFGAPASYLTGDTFGLATADVNHDGVTDLISVNSSSQSLRILLGNPSGTFRSPITSNFSPGPAYYSNGPGRSSPVLVTDIDGDGNPDIVFALGVSYGNGDGSFRAYVPFVSSYATLAIADLNGDGIADIAGTGSCCTINGIPLLMGHPSPVLSVTTTPSPVQVGLPLTFTVTASRQDATGAVTVTTDGYPRTIGTAALVNGSAMIVQNQAQQGGNYFWATYSGDVRYAATQSPKIYVLGQKPGPAVTLSATPNPAVLGQAVTLTATLSQAIGGSAQIAFYDGTSLLNTQALSSNIASTTVYLTPGAHQLRAVLPPSTDYGSSSSAILTEQVSQDSGGQLGNGAAFTNVAGIPGSLAVIDPDNDGVADLVVADTSGKALDLYLGGDGHVGAPVGLYLNFVPGGLASISSGEVLVTDPVHNLLYRAGFGNFNTTSPTSLASVGAVGTQPVAVAAADFDGDGMTDAITANAGSNSVTLLVGPDYGHVRTDIDAGSHPIAIVTGDFNNDGLADFAVANRDDNNVMIFAGNGDSSFQAPIAVSLGAPPSAMAAADLNGDGKLDLVIVSEQAGEVIVLLGNGNGTFRNAGSYSAPGATSLAIGAFGNTAAPAIAVTSSTGLLVFSGRGDGTFSAAANLAQYGGATAVVTGNFSSDRRMELAVSMPSANGVAYIYKHAVAASSLSISPSAAVAGQSVALTVNVSPPSASGAVTYYDGAEPIGSALVLNGQAVLRTKLLAPGSHALSARFLGAPGLAPAQTPAVNLIISPVNSLGLAAPIRQTLSNIPGNLVAGDFNGDGKLDFAFQRQGNGLYALLGNGDGTFAEKKTSAFGGYPAVGGDFNNDGNTDIVGMNSSAAVNLGTGTGDFVETLQVFGATPDQAAAMATNDINGDGIYDLFLAGLDGSAVVLLGAGDGSFQLGRRMQLGSNLTAVTTADVNRDGIPDFLTADSAGGLIVATGLGDGRFVSRDMQIPPHPVALATADFTGDNQADVALAHTSPNQLSVFAGSGDGSFTGQSVIPLPAAPKQLFAADINGDGKTDLVVGFTTGSPAFAVLYGNGDGTFQAPLTYDVGVADAPQAMAVGDVNNDGRLDVVVATYQFSLPYAKTLNVFLGTGMALTVVQGSGQSAQIGSNFQQAMQVSAPNGTQVIFTVPATGPGGSFSGSSSVSVTASNGIAAAPAFTANSLAGTYAVIASAPGLALSTAFSLTNTPGAATTIFVASGSSQSATVGTGYAAPLQALVKDANGNPVPNVTVTFTAPATGPSVGFGGAATVTATSNAAGIATSPMMTANGTAGTMTVSASIGTPATSAGFLLTNVSGVQVTITTAQTALPFLVDGVQYYSSHTFTWNAGDTHTISVAQTQTFSLVRYLFNSWSDGGPASHTITVPAAGTVITSSFQTQYLFTASPGPGGSISPATGFYNPGTLTVTATPNTGYTFTGFSGAVAGPVNPQTFNLTGPQTVYATFASQLPLLTVTVFRNGSFAQGQTGATYIINVGNAANAVPTSGSVTVTETLPQGVTLVSLSGQGATCSGTVCTLTAPIATCCYQITATVNIAPDAPLQITNRVTVSGGGSQPATATDTAALGPRQTISFAPIASVTYGTAPFTVNLSASSGLSVTLQSRDTTVCTVNAATVTLTGGGVCSLTATQSGNASFGAANPVTRSFLVNPTTQTVSFTLPPAAAGSSSSIQLNGRASSGLGVYYSSTDNFVCLVNGSFLTFQSAGTCTITAIQPGNASYFAATTAQTVVVGQVQSINFNAPATVPMSPTALTLSATATSGLSVSLASTTPAVCTVSGNLLTAIGVGTCSITATQAGDRTWAPAPPLLHVFTITQGIQTITFAPVGGLLLPGPPVLLTATVTSGLPVVFTSTTTGLCTVSGSAVTPLAAGTCTIVASQPGNAKYAAATPVTQSFPVNPLPAGGTGGGGGGGGGTAGGGGGAPAGGSGLSVDQSTVTVNANVNGSAASQTVNLSFQTYTQGAPSFSCNTTTNQGVGWLAVTPNSGTMTQASYQGLLYTYTAAITISGDPAGIAAGSTYTGNVNCLSNGGIASVAVTMNVSSKPPQFTLGASNLTFNYRMGGTSAPLAQPVSVTSTPTGAGFTATASTTSGGSWLTVQSSATSIIASVSPVSLAPGTYNGTITVRSGSNTVGTILVTFTVVPATAPGITAGGIVPVYSTITSIQSGSWISIYGTNLAPGTAVWNGDFPTSLGGVSVTMNGKPAYLWFVSPAQINLQAPDDIATGSVNVVVTTPSGTVTSTVTLAPASPSFSLLGDGKHVAAVIPTPDGSGAYGGGTYDLMGPPGALSFSARPVRPGETLVLFGVGFGPTNPPVPAGQAFHGAAPTVNPVTVTIGGVQANVAFAGITSAGLYQFNVTVPNVPSGDQTLQATVAGVVTGTGPVVTVQ